MGCSEQRILLVHGTGATAASDVGKAWWQTEHPLRAAIHHATKGAVPVEAFIWSGANSEAERYSAGQHLFARIEQLAGEGESVHLIGHSHGGSVIWHALQLLDRRKGKFAHAVRSWATVGTPFLKYGLRRARLTLALVVMTLASSCIGLCLASLQRTELAYAWRDDPAMTALWGGLALLPVLVIAWTVAVVLPFVWALIRRPRRPNDAITALGQSKYLGLWSTEDEPTIGLGATGSVSIRLLREGDSSTSRLNLQWLFHPVSAAVNQFVNNVLARAFQGSTIPYLELRATDNAPHPALAHKSLPRAVDRDLIDSANHHSASLGSRARELLVAGASPLTGFVDLQHAAAKSMSFRELVHTSYFDNAFCIDVLVHHLGQHGAHASTDQPAVDVESFYSDRRDENKLQRPPYVALPSNRAGYVIALASLGVGGILAILMLAQGSVHRQVLAPTMPDGYLSDLASPASLATVLAMTVPAEQLETAAGTRVWIKIQNDRLGFSTIEDDATVSKDLLESQKILRPYLINLLAAGKEVELLGAASKLESKGLRSLFYSSAWPVLLASASEQQLDRLLSPALIFPGAPQAPSTVALLDDNPYYPMYTTFDALARTGKLSPAIYRKLQLACGTSTLCQQQLQLQYAYALVNLNLDPDPAFLRPLPSPRLLAIALSGKKAYRPLLPFPVTANSPDNARLVRWLARHGDWDHMAILQMHTTAHPPEWKDVEEPAQRALATLHGEQVNWFLQVVLSRNWNSAPPAQFVSALKTIAGRRLRDSAKPASHVERSEYDVPMFSDSEVRALFTAGVARSACSALMTKPPEDAFTQRMRELEGTPDPCLGEKLRIMERTLNPNSGSLFLAKHAASSFGGDEGVFASLAHPIDTFNAKDTGSTRLALLLKTMEKAACATYSDEAAPFPGLSEADGARLAKALAMLGHAPAALPMVLDKWLTPGANPAQWCPRYDKENTEARENFFRWRQHFIYYLTNWLDEQHPREARAAMRDAAKDADGAGVADSTLLTRYASWFLTRKEPLEALALTDENRSGNLLLRRAAFYQIAACQLSAGDSKTALMAVTLAQVSGAAAATLGSPLELAEAIEAESQYHALRRDWRGSLAACSRCDERMRIAIAVGVAPFMIAEINGKNMPRQLCQPVSPSQVDRLVKDETAALCGVSNAKLSFQNGRPGCTVNASVAPNL